MTRAVMTGLLACVMALTGGCAGMSTPVSSQAVPGDDKAPGGVPITGGIGTSGLCGTLPQGRVPATCAGI